MRITVFVEGHSSHVNIGIWCTYIPAFLLCGTAASGLNVLCAYCLVSRTVYGPLILFSVVNEVADFSKEKPF